MNSKTARLFLAGSALLAGYATSLPSALAADSYSASYVINAIGVRVGKSNFTTTINGDAVSVKGDMRTSGIAAAFSSLNGTLNATGTVNGNGVMSSGFDVNYREGSKSKRTKIAFSGGNVASVENSPTPPARANWVDMPASELSQAVDPVLATIVRANSAREVCNRTIRMFDGLMRADITLSYRRTIPFSADGYKGDAVTCSASFKPVGGYDPTKRDLIYMRDNPGMEFSFAPIGSTNLWAPVTASVKTRIGTIKVRATRFKAG